MNVVVFPQEGSSEPTPAVSHLHIDITDEKKKKKKLHLHLAFPQELLFRLQAYRHKRLILHFYKTPLHCLDPLLRVINAK